MQEIQGMAKNLCSHRTQRGPHGRCTQREHCVHCGFRECRTQPACQRLQSDHRRAVTLMELLLVVAMMAVVAPLTVPTVTQYAESRNDEVAYRQAINLIAQTRSLGLLGRRDEAVLGLANASATMNASGKAFNLPKNYALGNFKIGGVAANNLAVSFRLNGCIQCNGVDVTSASVDLLRNGKPIRTIALHGQGIPLPEFAVAGGGGTVTSGGGGGGGGGCGWF